MTDIKKETAKLLKKEFGIDEKTTSLLFDKGLLFLPACRNVLIREEYRSKAQPNEKQRVKGRIAERYCISVNLVRKLVE